MTRNHQAASIMLNRHTIFFFINEFGMKNRLNLWSQITEYDSDELSQNQHDMMTRMQKDIKNVFENRLVIKSDKKKKHHPFNRMASGFTSINGNRLTTGISAKTGNVLTTGKRDCKRSKCRSKNHVKNIIVMKRDRGNEVTYNINNKDRIMKDVRKYIDQVIFIIL